MPVHSKTPLDFPKSKTGNSDDVPEDASKTSRSAGLARSFDPPFSEDDAPVAKASDLPQGKCSHAEWREVDGLVGRIKSARKGNAEAAISLLEEFVALVKFRIGCDIPIPQSAQILDIRCIETLLNL